MANLAPRRQILSLYRRILNVAKNWEAKSGIEMETIEQRNYIKKEAQNNFRNYSSKNPTEIDDCIKQAEARLAIAVHYRNPYPRPVNVPPKSYSKRRT